MEHNPPDKPFSFRQRLHSFRYAFLGIQLMIKTEHNFRIHLASTVLVIIAGFFFRISTTEWLLVVFAIGMVLSAETFNSAIEQLTDLVSPNFNPKAGRIKDLAAGAVLFSSIAAALIGLIIFVPKIMDIL